MNPLCFGHLKAAVLNAEFAKPLSFIGQFVFELQLESAVSPLRQMMKCSPSTAYPSSSRPVIVPSSTRQKSDCRPTVERLAVEDRLPSSSA